MEVQSHQTRGQNFYYGTQQYSAFDYHEGMFVEQMVTMVRLSIKQKIVPGLVIVEIVLLEDNQGKQELKLWEDMWKRGISGSIQLKVYALRSFTKTLLTNVYVKKAIKLHMIMTTWHEKHFSTCAQFSHVVIVHSSVACTLFMNNMRVRIKKMF